MINKNEKSLNDLFNQAKNDPVQVSFDETKMRFIDSVKTGVGVGKKKSLFNLKNVIMVTLVSAIVVATVIQVNQSVEVVSNEVVPTKEFSQTDVNIQKEVKPYFESFEKDEKSDIFEKNQVKNFQENDVVENKRITGENDLEYQEKKNKTLEFGTVYKFPILTEKEEIENQKRKRRMLKYLVKFNKKQYVFIPSGSLKTENGTKSIQSFYIQNAEVTNMQYRTFLIDLVQKGDKEKFKLASPHLDVWPKKYDGTPNPLNEQYFSHPAYDHYPVVGVSQEGVELYCNWLSEEVVAYYPKNRYEDTYIKVRIPTDVEWMYVANEGGGEIKHQWSSEGLQNEAGCYLANYNTGGSNDGAVYTARIKTYNPNSFGVFNIFGNVAEMVYYLNGKRELGVKGGGWDSDIDALDIDFTDPNKGNVKPSSNVGFRVVISFVKR